MPKKKTHEEYIAELSKINPNIEVLGTYNGSKTKILHKCKIDGYEWETIPNNVLRGHGCPKCGGKIHRTYEQYIKKLAIINPNIEVLGTYINTQTKILHKCKIDGYKWEVDPSHLLCGRGCPVCSGRVVGPPPEYKNSIWASKYKEYFSKFLTEDLMKQYTPKSGHKIQVNCPDCKRNKQISIHNLYYHGLACECGDGQSYPNKFIYSMLEQLKISYINEYSPKWANKKRYDIYLPLFNCIIEMHGQQHYIYTGFMRTIEDEQENDKIKKEIALKNNIKNYIVINCSRSDRLYIKNNIMNSKLPSILNFNENDINWMQCHVFALSNLVKVVANLWNKTKSIDIISNELKISKYTIRNYLKIASELNWCNWYSGLGKEIYYKKKCGANNPASKKVINLDTLEIFESCNEAAKRLCVNAIYISKVCKKKQKTVRGCHFMYYDEWLAQKSNKTS